MSNKVNFTFVGIVILTILIFMFVFIVWLGRPNNKENFTKYYIYFNESVAGLNIKSPVKYKGVNVGKVLNIEISPKDYKNIRVLVSIKSNTPINSSTRATLNVQGITGLAFINLTLHDIKAPPLVKNKHGIATIKTSPSLFNRVEKSLGGVTTRLSRSLSNLNKLLSPKNIANISVTLKQARELMQNANRAFDAKTVHSIDIIASNLNQTSIKINKMIPSINTLIAKTGKLTTTASTALRSTANSFKDINKSIYAFKSALAHGEFNLKKISGNTLSNLNITLDTLDKSMLNFNNFINRYKNNPSALFLEFRKQIKGPGER